MHRQKEYTVVPTAPLFPRLAITQTNDDLLQMGSKDQTSLKFE